MAKTKLIKQKPEETFFMLTDGCMWEKNKQAGTRAPHCVEVVNVHTGQVQFIKSGSIIALVEGEITPPHSQEEYNKQKPE